jgi:hypothetical protein
MKKWIGVLCVAALVTIIIVGIAQLLIALFVIGSG